VSKPNDRRKAAGSAQVQRLLQIALAVAVAAALSLAAAQTADLLRIGVADLPPTLEPGVETSNTGVRLIPSIFETLLEMDPTDNSILLPRLATSWERLDDLSMAFTLREGVVFHDGTPFTGADVKYSLERLLDPDFAGALARSLMSIIERVDVIDDHTVHVITRGPDPILDYRLASAWGSWIIPAGYHAEVGVDDFGRAPIGTGPFRLVEYTPDTATLEVFDGYWGDRPNVDRVEFRVIPEIAARVTALVNNEVQLITTVPPDQVASLQQRAGILVKSTIIDNMHMQIYHAHVPPLTDMRLRQALALAIDRELLVETIWNDMAEVPRGHQYEAYGPLYDASRSIPQYDPEKARQLIAESGYAGEPIYYDVVGTYYTNELAAAEAITAMWQDVGLNVRVRVVDASVRSAGVGGRPIDPAGGIFAWSNTMRFPDPIGGLWLLWGPETNCQRHHWSPVNAFNEVGRQMEVEMDPARRRELALSLIDLWEEESPGTVLWYPSESYGLRDTLLWEPDRSHSLDFRPHLLAFRD
jgi:peptide/nickel transport system substrate-binding protein